MIPVTVTSPAVPDQPGLRAIWARDVARSCFGCRYQTTGTRWVLYYVNPWCPWHGK